MTDVANDLDPMSPEVQIRCAIEEGMANIFRAVFGENLSVDITYTLASEVISGVQMVAAQASFMSAKHRKFTVLATVPVQHPDIECGGYRIADEFFMVRANDWAESCQFEVWCEHNPYNGAKVIVRHVFPDKRERWLVADSMECEVLYRGPFESLFPWAKEVVSEKWSHLPHVCLDTEQRAMLFISLRTQGGS
jgi:hypothetical protein